MTPLVALPLITLILLYKLFLRQFSFGTSCKRRYAIVCSFLCFSLLVIVLSEVLSEFHLLTFPWLLALWIVLPGVLLLYELRQVSPFSLLLKESKEFLQYFNKHPLLIVVGVALSISLFVAIVYPPNNFDSMTYHMARVAHWEQNASIAHYRTHIIRQIEFPPLSEWIILQLQILTGGDNFANSVQLAFFAAAIAGVTLIAAFFGANNNQQVLTAVAACFIPMAVIQSNTTQNDIVLSFFVISFVLFTLHLFRAVTIRLIFFSGVALGCAWLTKGTAYIFTALFCAWYLIIFFKACKQQWPLLFKKIACIACVPLVAVCINLGHYDRNIFYSGSPLGNAGEGTVIEGHEWKQVGLVVAKNLMNHLPVTRSMKQGLRNFARLHDVDLDDPKYNFVDIKFMVEGLSFHEDYAQNLPQVLLIPVFGLFILFRKGTYSASSRLYLLYVLTLFASSFLFCALLQWQPWANRLQTPLFILFASLIGIELGKLRNIPRNILVFLLVAYGFIALFRNEKHPLLPVRRTIFAKPAATFIYSDSLVALADYVKSLGVAKIGLYIGLDSWDYPYYRLLADNQPQKRQIRHVFVQNNSTIYVEAFLPDVIISQETSIGSYTLGDVRFPCIRRFGEYALFKREAK